MNLRLVVIISIALAGPSLYSMVQGRLDPDAAMLRMMLAVAFAVFADAMIRGFVRVTQSEDPSRPAGSAQHAPGKDQEP